MNERKRIMKRFRLMVNAWYSRTMRGVVRRWAMTVAFFVSASILAPRLVHADDRGCQVLLCLSNPDGPKQYSTCVLPMEQQNSFDGGGQS
jgi:hypothetical protein